MAIFIAPGSFRHPTAWNEVWRDACRRDKQVTRPPMPNAGVGAWPDGAKVLFPSLWRRYKPGCATTQSVYSVCLRFQPEILGFRIMRRQD